MTAYRHLQDPKFLHFVIREKVPGVQRAEALLRKEEGVRMGRD
jgi:hypothetical protein